MFRDYISSTPYTTDVADNYFSNIGAGGTIHNLDDSLTATLRALVSSRLAEDETLEYYLANADLPVEITNDWSLDDACRFNYYVDNEILFINIREESDLNGKSYFDRIIEMFEDIWDKNRSCPNQFKRDIQVTQFYEGQFKIASFVNRDRKTTVIFIERLDIRKWHYIQCALFAWLPWFFEDRSSVTDEEREVLFGLAEKQPEKYLAALEKLSEQYDFYTMKVEKLLAGFEQQETTRLIENRIEEISNCISQINRYNQAIGELLKEKREKEVNLAGLKAKLAESEGESEIKDYFLCNKTVLLDDVNRSEFRFTVKDYAMYWDEDIAELVIKNHNTDFYTEKPWSDVSEEDIERFLRAVFIDQTLKLRICAQYYFSINGNVRSVSDATYQNSCKTYMPNPHIHAYACMGNYTQIINEVLLRHDYIGAIEQCVASARSLNFGDGAVMDRFVRYLYGRESDIPTCVIETPDGDVIEVRDAIELLKPKEKTDE